jgi:hypothetical protein
MATGMFPSTSSSSHRLEDLFQGIRTPLSAGTINRPFVPHATAPQLPGFKQRWTPGGAEGSDGEVGGGGGGVVPGHYLC